MFDKLTSHHDKLKSHRTSIKYMPRRDKTDVILRWSCSMENSFFYITAQKVQEILKKHVRYNVLMVYLVSLIHVKQ